MSYRLACYEVEVSTNKGWMKALKHWIVKLCTKVFEDLQLSNHSEAVFPMHNTLALCQGILTSAQVYFSAWVIYSVPPAQCSWDRHQIHCTPDQDEAVTEDNDRML